MSVAEVSIQPSATHSLSRQKAPGDLIRAFTERLATDGQCVKTLVARARAYTDAGGWSHTAPVKGCCVRGPCAWSPGAASTNTSKAYVTFKLCSRACACKAPCKRTPACASAPCANGAWLCLLAHADDPKLALADFRAALDLEPDCIDAWYYRGTLFAKLNLLDQASVCLRACRALHSLQSCAPGQPATYQCCCDLGCSRVLAGHFGLHTRVAKGAKSRECVIC